MEINTVGVVGAGVMGVGVAQNLAQIDQNVILIDISQDILERAKENMTQNIRFFNMFSKSTGLKASDEVINKINFTTDIELLRNTDVVIENVTEKWDIKKDVYSRLDDICPKHCIFASNTSAISITRIASATQKPEKVIGTHFMNPVPMKKMVEVIRGFHTSDETINTTKSLLENMGKECVLVNDMPGFVSNRD